jgi:hypothetical protein
MGRRIHGGLVRHLLQAAGAACFFWRWRSGLGWRWCWLLDFLRRHEQFIVGAQGIVEVGAGPELPERLRARMALTSSTLITSRDFSPSFMVTIE